MERIDDKMSSNTLLLTSTVSLSDILNNGNYKVPTYQRDYSWKNDHWEDLWEDIMLIVRNPETVHYMGSIVLQVIRPKVYSVIDGQQRLTTLSLIVLATIKCIKDLVSKDIDGENNNERIKLLSQRFLGSKDPGSLTYSSKLELNENNNEFFQSHLLVFRPALNPRTLRDSDKLLLKAYEFFYQKVSLQFQGTENGQALADFLNKLIAEKLMFIQIVVQNEFSAYTVFETLNSRGERLTISDLLKNFLFSLVTSTDLPHVRNKWQRTVDIAGLTRFPVFLRHFWISKNPVIRLEHLFKVMKENVKTPEAVIDLLDQLESNAQLYVALGNYSDPFWVGKREIKRRIKELNLFNEKQALPLLLAAYNNLDEEEFLKVLKLISIITFRFSVIGGQNPNLKEETYNKAAIKITRKEVVSAAQLAHEVKSLYPSDREFRNDFSTLVLSTRRNKKLVRYILFELENHLSQTNHDFEDNPASIEHILPENPSTAWAQSFPPLIHEAYVYRLGNYSLLEDGKNRMIGNNAFEDKRPIYQASQFHIAKDVRSSDWTSDSIEHRQARLAASAVALWRLPYYDQEVNSVS